MGKRGRDETSARRKPEADDAVDGVWGETGKIWEGMGEEPGADDAVDEGGVGRDERSGEVR